MTNSNSTTPTPARRGWLKKLLFVFGGLLLLVIVAWFVATSEAFFKGVILPRAGKAMNATLTAESASISPFSQVSIRGLKVQTTGTEPLLAVNEVRARYSLTAMLGGTIQVDEVLIDSPVVNVIFHEDGTSNLDALSAGEKTAASAEPQPAKSGPQVDLKQFHLKNATVRYTKQYTNGTQDTVEIKGVNVTLADVKNGAAGKLDFALEASANLNPPDAAQRGTAQLKHDGKYTFTLGSDLFPTQISGSDRTDVITATGALAALAGFGVDLVIELTPTELKPLALTFRQAGKPMGELRVTGPFDALKREGKLTATISGIDHRQLNPLVAAAGLDLGGITIGSTNVIEVTQGGGKVSVNGQLQIANLIITRAGQATPKLDVLGEYNLSADTAKGVATLQTLVLNATQNSRPLIESQLSAPMSFATGAAAVPENNAMLTLDLKELRLPEWKAFTGDSIASGVINANLKLSPRAGGKQLALDLSTTVQDFAGATSGASPSYLTAKSTLNTVAEMQDNGMLATGKLAVTELINRTGAKELRMPPLSINFAINQSANVIEIKQLETVLAPIARAANKLNLTGRVDMTQPDAITGSLKLAADSLDLTEYYNLFMTDTASAQTTPAAPAPASATEKEPDAMTLPFRNFTAEAALGHVYLRELDISNVQVKATLDGGNVIVKPLECALNGAPVNGSLNLNLGVPGFQYEFNLDAPDVPFAPLVNSFQPDRKGQIAGTATVSAQLKGAGTTGASLQQHLAGQFDFVATNMNLSLENVRTPAAKSLIHVIVAIPDAIRNPGAAMGNLLGGLLGTKSESSSKWVDELMKSPVTGVEVHGAVRNGTFEVKETYVASAAFLGEAAGTLNIASVLSNSVMHLPVKISLSKSLSDKVGLTPANTPTNAVYVALPDFVKMGGTLGQPKPDVDKLVLAQLALKSGAGIGQNIGGAAGETVGGVLGAVGNLLGGATTTKTNAATTTNAPASTNATAPNQTSDLIKGIGGLFGGKKKAETNSPANP